MKKDSHIIEIFHLLDNSEATVALVDGRVLKVWNVAWNYDDQNDFAHITSNISPEQDGKTIDFFFTNEIKTISKNGNQFFSNDEKLKSINLIYLRSGELILTSETFYHWRQLQSKYNDYMASIDFESIEKLIEFLKIEYKVSENEILDELNKKQFSWNKTIEFEIKKSI